MKYAIIGIATAVLISLGGYLITSYGNSKYDKGYAKAYNEMSTANSKLAASNAKLLEELSNEVRNSTDVDADLLELGIMRKQEDW